MTSRELTDEQLQQIYRDRRHPASLGGIDKFTEALRKEGYNVSKRTVRRVLQEDDLYQLHKPSRKTFPRRPFIVQGIDHIWQIDLSDVSSLKQHNDGHRFLLFVIDTFSKYGWVRAIKNKAGPTLVAAMESVLDTSDRRPLHLHSDKGSEFVNRHFKSLMADRNINFYTSQNEETKAAIVERLQRTFKTKLFRYFTANNSLRYLDVIQDVMHSYNHTKHRSIGLPPTEVTRDTEDRVRRRLCKTWSIGKTRRRKDLDVGDNVRISIARRPFRKGYLPQWTEEIFFVREKLSTKPVTYRLEDYNKEVLKGTFYREELQRLSKRADRVYRVEKVLKTRTRGGRKQHFVKWFGYPKHFNSWIWEEDLA